MPLNVGQATVDPVTGLAGAIWTATYGNPNSNINPAYTPTPPTLSPSPGLPTANQKIRNNLAAAMESQAAVMASFLSFGSANILSGHDHVIIADSAVNVNTVVSPCVNGLADDATLFVVQRYSVQPGVSVTLYGNAPATLSVLVSYIAVNPP